MRLLGALCILPLLAASQVLQLSSVPLKTDDSILSLTSPSLLQDILVPRPVGSDALATAQDAFEKRFKALGWHVERDEFEDDTPVGRKPFRNIIFTSDPSKPRTVVLAAHIDSKPEPEGFVGAIDSAAPCAILMDVANSLAPWLKTQQAKSDTSITIVLFDGEEAFKRWTATDSIYGARHLAKEWSKPLSAPGTASAQLRNSSRLATIDVFILLDLLGSPNPSIRSFYQNTHWLFERFQQAQSRLGEASLIQGQGDFFSQGAYGGHIEGEPYHCASHGLKTNGAARSQTITFPS